MNPLNGGPVVVARPRATVQHDWSNPAVHVFARGTRNRLGWWKCRCGAGAEGYPYFDAAVAAGNDHVDNVRKARAIDDAQRIATPERLADRSDPLMTTDEVAALFRVSRQTVRNWANAGQLASIRTVGGHLRVRESDVRALLARGEQS